MKINQLPAMLFTSMLCLGATYFNPVFGQEKQSNFISSTEIKAPATEAFVYYQDEQIKIEISEEFCNDVQNGIHNTYLMIRVANKTTESIKVSFRKEIWKGTVCLGCNGGDEQKITIRLAPNETQTGSCIEKSKDLKIFKNSGDNFTTPITKFELKDILVTK